jgi:hypothetical protein
VNDTRVGLSRPSTLDPEAGTIYDYPTVEGAVTPHGREVAGLVTKGVRSS